MDPAVPTTVASKITNYTTEYLPRRGITKETHEFFKVKTRVDPDGVPVAVEDPYANGSIQVRHLDEKQFYSELSDALRTYFEQAFNVACLDKTTTEILLAIQHNATLRPHTQLVQSILEQADIIKFAKAVGTPEKRQHDVLNALHILEHTKTTRPSAV